ncbi:hypothetical protein ACQ4WX_50280 [Streptomyces lasalocidi]
MEMNPTALLLDLAARAQRMSDPNTLHGLLAAGHRAWCEGVAEVQAGVGRESASLSDARLAERCTAAGAPWEQGMTRGEAVSALTFAIWDASLSRHGLHGAGRMRRTLRGVPAGRGTALDDLFQGVGQVRERSWLDGWMRQSMRRRSSA